MNTTNERERLNKASDYLDLIEALNTKADVILAQMDFVRLLPDLKAKLVHQAYISRAGAQRVERWYKKLVG